MAGLKALNGGLGQGSKAPVEWSGALARPNQLLLQCCHLLGAAWLAVAGAGCDQAGLGLGAGRIALGLGRHR
jgi:hypothetical protein